MISLGRRLILFLLLFLFAVQNGLGQNNTLYEQQDCINLINSINSRYNKSNKYNMETYANEVVVPCLVDNMINIMKRNNISLEDHKNRDIILEKSISCILSSFSSENKNPEESFNRKMYGALLSTIFSSIFNPDMRSSSSSSSQSNKSSVNSAPNKCTYCKPSDSKGWYITDYDDYKKIHTNGRYVKNIGHKPCSTCHGTANCKAYNTCSSIWNKESNSCIQCKGDRWQECDMCKGTGESK
jgi:hypothetical protein